MLRIPSPALKRTSVCLLSPKRVNRCKPWHRLWLGRKHVDDDIIARLRRNLKPADRAALVQDAPQAPGWIADIFHRLAKD